MTDETVGQSTEWIGDYKFRLVPILCIELAQLASDPDYAQNACNILEYWITIENHNLTRVRANLHGWEMPDRYETNVLPGGSRVSQWLGRPSEELLNDGIRHLSECLELLGRQLHDTGNIVTAAEVALLQRHLHKNFRAAFGNELNPGGLLSYVCSSLNKLLGTRRYVWEGVDELQTLIDDVFRKHPNR